jgi:hypothetical protein
MKQTGCLMLFLIILLHACNSDYLNPSEEEVNVVFINQNIIYEGTDILPIIDQGYLVGGRSVDFTSRSNDDPPVGCFSVVKISWSGKLVWKYSLGGSDIDYCTKIKMTSDSSCIAVGFINDTDDLGINHTDIAVVKLNLKGSVIWEKVYGGLGNQVGNDIEETIDGGYIIAGSTDASSPTVRDMLLFKINKDGDSLWTESYGYSGDDYAVDVEEQADGGLIAMGSTEQSYGMQTGYNIFLLKTNQNGKGPVNRILGAAKDDFGVGVEIVVDGYILVANNVLGASSSISLIKLGTDIYGDPIFVREYQPNSFTKAESVIVHDNRLILAGYQGNDMDGNIMFMALDLQGNMIKNQIYGGSNMQKAICIKAQAKSGFVVLFRNQFIDGDITGLMKLNAEGEPY